MPWVKSTVAGVPAVEFVGEPPEHLYHLTEERHLRGIRRARELRPTRRGRGGFSAAGAIEGGVSFTDDVSSFMRRHPYAWDWRILRLRTEHMPGVRPVVYVGGRNILEQGRGMHAVRDAGGQARSMAFLPEREWWTPETVPLVEEAWSVSLPMRMR